jgi:hypothetical protein
MGLGLGLRLAGSAIPGVAAQFGLPMGAALAAGLGAPALISNIRGRQTGFNNPTASGVPGALIAAAYGGGSGGLIGSGLSALAYKQGREAGKKKRIENTIYDSAVTKAAFDNLRKDFNPDNIEAFKAARDMERMTKLAKSLQYMPRPINNLSGGMATQPQLGTAMGIANQIYGMQQ